LGLEASRRDAEAAGEGVRRQLQKYMAHFDQMKNKWSVNMRHCLTRREGEVAAVAAEFERRLAAVAADRDAAEARCGELTNLLKIAREDASRAAMAQEEIDRVPPPPHAAFFFFFNPPPQKLRMGEMLLAAATARAEQNERSLARALGRVGDAPV
jgi:hypothetical protein